MPNRMLKESINESRGLTNCSIFAQDLYKRLITYADDYGRFNADPQIMIARLYPRELAVISMDDLIDGLIELCGVGKIAFYTTTQRSEIYGRFPNWQDHQRIRESKKKMPDPQDTEINDWYLRRFIPLAMKIEILRRYNFKCQICGKHVIETTDADKAVKMGTGLFHFDHIVPCQQGGRATLENLRLTCPSCNLSRKKRYSFDEILNFTGDCANSPQLAATRRKLRPESNPIQSESNPNPNPSEKDARARFTPPTVEEVRAYAKEKGYAGFDPERFVDFYTSKGWRVGRDPMKDWKASVRGWVARDRDDNKRTAPGASNPALNYEQRDYSGTKPKPERVYIAFDGEE